MGRAIDTDSSAALDAIRRSFLDKLWIVNWVGLLVAMPLGVYSAWRDTHWPPLMAYGLLFLAQLVLGAKSLSTHVRAAPAIAAVGCSVWAGFALTSSPAGACACALLLMRARVGAP